MQGGRWVVFFETGGDCSAVHDVLCADEDGGDCIGCCWRGVWGEAVWFFSMWLKETMEDKLGLKCWLNIWVFDPGGFVV